MLMRSTGLGKAELTAEVADIKRRGDYLIMEMHTTEPVRWKIRVGVNRKDLGMIFKIMLKPPLLGFMLNVKGWFRKADPPGTY